MKHLILIGLLILCNSAYSQQQKLNKKTIEDFTYQLDSYLYLSELESLVMESKFLMISWVKNEKVSDTPNKIRLKQINNKSIPAALKKLDYLAQSWRFSEKEIYNEIKQELLQLNDKHNHIMEVMNTYASYDDLMTLFEVVPEVEPGGPTNQIADNVLNKIEVFKYNFYQSFNSYLPPSPIKDSQQIVEIDPKIILIDLFIDKYNLKTFVSSVDDYSVIYNEYSLQDLKDALNESLKKDSDFYLRYNKIVIELSK